MIGTIAFGGNWPISSHCLHRWKEVKDGNLTVRYLKCELCGDCYPLN